MGVNDREQDRKDDKRRAKQEKERTRRNRSTASTPADWETCNHELLAKAVAAVAGMGGAIRLGYTRDGGAYAVGIYGDGEPFTEYIPPSDDLDEYLKGLIDDYLAGKP